MLVAALKGLVEGACNTSLALTTGAHLPALATIGASLAVGFFGYGLSLTLFVIGLRVPGTARTGAYTNMHSPGAVKARTRIGIGIGMAS